MSVEIVTFGCRLNAFESEVIAQEAARDQQLDEAVKIGVALDERPIEPTGFVVLAVGVVVAVLRAPDLVAHHDHGDA